MHTASRRLAALVATGLLAGLLVPIAAATPAAAAPVRYEAEQATISQGVVESNHLGYSGTGFVNTDNVIGPYVEWTVSAAAASSTTLALRYSNGTTVNRPMTITVNGVTLATPAFGSTTSWDTWATVTQTATLAAGTNTIRATATTSNGGPNLDYLEVGTSDGGGTDWSVAMVESTMARYTPTTIGGWSYPVALYMYGQYLVYKRVGDHRYLDYIKAWMDRFVDNKGNVSQSYDSLDSMLPGRVLLVLYKETGLAKYRIAAQKIHDRFATYPRTSDGAFWHATSRTGQLWADGAFMSMPFLAEYGQVVGDSTYSWDEATKQITLYASHLQQPNGLLKHAYDEPRDQSWADPVTGVSPEYWCRAIGWFGMATTQILDVIPADHPRRAQLITIAQNMVRGFATYQDPASGRWFQVVDKGSRSDDWTETSCSSMYAYTIDKSVEKGYVAASYQVNADRGYAGVLGRISLGADGRTNLTDISEGTNVGDYAFYVARARLTNDFHGLGAFLIMNEQLRG